MHIGFSSSRCVLLQPCNLVVQVCSHSVHSALYDRSGYRSGCQPHGMPCVDQKVWLFLKYDIIFSDDEQQQVRNLIRTAQKRGEEKGMLRMHAILDDDGAEMIC